MTAVLPGSASSHPAYATPRYESLTSAALLVSILTVVAALATACSTSPAPAKPPQATGSAVSVATATRGDISSSLTFTGDLRARSTVVVLPKTSGQIQRLLVDVGQRVKAGDLIAELDATPLEAQVRQGQAALAAAQFKLASMEAGARSELVAQAEAALHSAQQRLVTITNGPRSEVVAQAEANVRAAEARLKQLKDGPTDEQRRMAKMNVEGAKVKLHAANIQKDGDCSQYKPDYLCQASQANAIAAAYAVDAAQAQYDALVAPPTAEQIAQAQAAVDAARQQYQLAQKPFTEQDLAQVQDAVRVAEQQLSLVQNPFTKQDLDAMRAQVNQAQAAADLARYQLDQARIFAPVGGVIADRLLAQGALAGPTTPIVSISSDDLEMAFSVDERQASQLSVGMPVQITLSALPTTSLETTIASISPTVDPRTRSFLVKVLPPGADNKASGQLRPGMFGQAKVLVRRQVGVTLVPKEALVQRGGKTVVFVVADGRAKLVEVVTGLTDDKSAEVVRGLDPGAQVTVGGTEGLYDNDPVNVVQ